MPITLRQAATLAALTLTGLSEAHAQTLQPCTSVAREAFFQAFNSNSGIDILDVGNVVKEPGYNVCSVIIDTTDGSVRFGFTTDLTVNGNPIWRRVFLEALPRNRPQAMATPIPYAPPTYTYTAPPAQPAPVAVTAAPPPVAPITTTASVDPDFASFATGKKERLGWERFFGGTVGDEHDGALFWSSQRSLKNPGSCASGPSDQFRRGCEEAQAILGPSDVQRKTNPAYRAGWNSL